MDELEVKVEEISAKIDQIAYAKVDPARYKEISDEGKMVTPGTGKGGGGSGGILDIALAVATGILGVDLLKNILGQSQILNKISESIFKALGLAVDLVLLPFMPLIVWFLMGLYGLVKLLVPSGSPFPIPSVYNPDGTPKTKLQIAVDWISMFNDMAKAWKQTMVKLALELGLLVGELGANIIAEL